MTWHSGSRPYLADLEYTLPCRSGKYFCSFLWSVACLCLLYINRSLVFSRDLATDLLQLLFISLMYFFFYFSNCGGNEKEAFLTFCSQKCTELMDLKKEMFGTYFKQCRAFKLYYRILPSFFFPFEKEVEVMLTTILVPLQPQDMGRAL